MDDWASLAAMCGMIGEWVGSLWDERSSVHAARSTASVGASYTTVATTEASASTAEASSSPTTTEAAAKASAAAASCESASEAAASSTKAATSTAWWSIGKSVFANLECTTLPFVSVELTDGVACVISVVEDDDTGTLGATIRSEVNVSTYDVSDLSCEKLL